MKKTDEVRRKEAELIRSQLDELGFPEESLKDVQAALSDFCQGWGSTRTFKFPDLGVSVLLLLSTQAHITSYARVRKL